MGTKRFGDFFQNGNSKDGADTKEIVRTRLVEISDLIKESETNIQKLEKLSKKYDDSIQKMKNKQYHPSKIEKREQGKKDVAAAIADIKKTTDAQKLKLDEDWRQFFQQYPDKVEQTHFSPGLGK